MCRAHGAWVPAWPRASRARHQFSVLISHFAIRTRSDAGLGRGALIFLYVRHGMLPLLFLLAPADRQLTWLLAGVANCQDRGRPLLSYLLFLRIFLFAFPLNSKPPLELALLHRWRASLYLLRSLLRDSHCRQRFVQPGVATPRDTVTHRDAAGGTVLRDAVNCSLRFRIFGAFVVPVIK